MNRLFRWGCVTLYCSFIFFMSAQRDLTLPDIPSIDKFAHLLEYAGLGWLCAYAWNNEEPRRSIFSVILFATSFAVAYGASDEWHQLYVHGRSSDWHDWLADICGGLIGGMLYVYWLRFKEHFWLHSEL